MDSNPYQPLVNLLSNVLEAYTTAFFIFDEKSRRLNLAAMQSLSKFIPPQVSLPLEGSGILSQVQKVGQTIHLEKLHEATSSISLTLPFYREGESHIKGLYAAPVAGGSAILYVDTKYGWGFNDKQQKWIREFADLLGGLLTACQAEGRHENYARVFEVLHRLDDIAFQGYELDNYCGVFTTEWAGLLGMDYGFLVLREPGAKNFRVIGATANTPRGLVTQGFSASQGLIGWVLQNSKNLLIMRLNPATTDHYLFSRGENLPHQGTVWGMRGQTSLGYEMAIVFLSRQPVEWNTDSERAVAHAFHFLLLLLEQFYCKEENEALQSYDISTGLFNASAFEARVEGIFHASMKSNAPFSLGLIQFEPWQILTTKAQPQRIRQLQRELATSLCDALPPGVLVGQLTQNRFGLLFAKTNVHEAESQLSELAGYGKIALKGIKGVKLHPYIASAGFPQDVAKMEELWPLVSRRLFASFGVRPENAVS
jgi:GGDEF domain-containing protein